MTQSRRRIKIQIDKNPRYVGTIHDDAVARRQGYRAALVPGAFLYGHFSRFAVDTWGMAWIERGAISIRFRRAVYNEDVVELVAITANEADIQQFELELRDPEGAIAATGSVSLPAISKSAPEIAPVAILPVPDPKPIIPAGGMTPGLRGGTACEPLPIDEVRESLSAFGEDHPIYAGGRLVHSGCLMRKAMFEVNRSFSLPGPYVLTACSGQHFAPMQAGQTFATVSTVRQAFERNGRHYFVSDETVLADGRPVATFVREQIYAISKGDA